MGCSGSKLLKTATINNNINMRVAKPVEPKPYFELERYWYSKATTEIHQNEYDNVKKVMRKLGI